MNARTSLVHSPSREALKCLVMALAALAPGGAVSAAGAAQAQAVAPASPSAQRGTLLRDVQPQGQRIATTWRAAHELEVVRLVTQTGEREPNTAEVPLVARSVEALRFVDEVLARDARGVRDFRREYDSASASLEMRDRLAPVESSLRSRVELTSDLTGTRVRHVWNPDGTVGRHYDQREAREALLANVGGPLAWGGLLRDAPVELASEWDISPSALAVLFAPVGELGYRGPAEGGDPQLVRSFLQGLGGNLHLGFAGHVQGTARGQLFELGVVDGHKRATVRVTFEIELTADGTDFARRRALETEREDGVEVLESSTRHVLKGAVDVRWDVDGRRPLDARLTADETVELRIVVQPEEGERATQRVEFKGTCTIEMALAPAPKASNEPGDIAPGDTEPGDIKRGQDARGGSDRK
ncbi:MAG: hypothetical protein R3F49_00220 [Planctomycetota bacterium]